VIEPGEHGKYRRGYYGLPVLKAPVWRWEIWTYFFLGGLAAGSYLIASIAALVGDAHDRRASRIGFLLSAAAVAFCPPLLIKDLGRPARFLNMLRVLKPGSPMSVGVWGLVGFSACSILTALREWTNPDAIVGRLVRAFVPLRPLLLLGIMLASLLGGYTGVLLSVTSVPLWARSRLLGPAFFASALSSGASAVSLALAVRGEAPSTRRKVENVHLVAAAVEGLMLLGFLRQAGDAAEPIVNRRRHGRAFLVGSLGVGIALPCIAGLIRWESRLLSILLSLCTLVGGLSLRYAIVEGGRASAENPEATFRLTDKPIEKPSS
jgi:formate-dependent nitrite reductase membrane component NrfD